MTTIKFLICCVLVLVALSMPAAGQYFGGIGSSAAAAAAAASGGRGPGYGGYPYGGYGGGIPYGGYGGGIGAAAAALQGAYGIFGKRR